VKSRLPEKRLIWHLHAVEVSAALRNYRQKDGRVPDVQANPIDEDSEIAILLPAEGSSGRTRTNNETNNAQDQVYRDLFIPQESAMVGNIVGNYFNGNK